MERPRRNANRWLHCLILLMGMALTSAAVQAEVKVSGLFTDHMVLQRGRPVPVFGQATPGEKVTVTFHGQSGSTLADARGDWKVTLKAIPADTVGQPLTVAGSNTIRIADVLVGDVWLCSGQSNMAFGLNGCDRPSDVAAADYPGIRQFAVPLAFSADPVESVPGVWSVCTSRSAPGFSATAFYFARKIYLDQKATVPIGLIVSSVGGTRIDLWLAPEGVVDLPMLHPLLRQNPLPAGPFSLFNGMIFPLAPYGIRGALWYQGENSEVTTQSRDSYYLKMKALVQGWKRLWGMDDLPFYYVMLANWGELPTTSTPETTPGRGWDADTRLQQANALAIPHSGMASALDIGESTDMHPKDKLDLGERLALWALKNEYGHADLVTCGPILKGTAVSGATVVCSFDHIGKGLMVGAKAPYQPTRETPGAPLQQFVIAGEDGVWFPAQAVLRGDQVVLSSPSVPAPRKVAYACRQNPLGCNLYNRAGLPASPFYVEDVRRRCTIRASAGKGGRISGAGTIALLPRATALYRITPDPGHYVQDVQVDGVSVGAVNAYAFDPVYADHTLTATFAAAAPRYTITATGSGGGVLTPSGKTTVGQDGSCTFEITPEGENLAAVKIDGVGIGKRSRVTFRAVRADHTLEVVFLATIRASAGYGGIIDRDGLNPAPYASDQAFVITPLPGYAVSEVRVDGQSLGAVQRYTFANVTRSHTLAATFRSVEKIGTGGIPRPDRLLFACRSDALPAGGTLSVWPASLQGGPALRRIGNPAVESIDGRKYARIVYEQGDGFTVGAYTAPIACAGASIVVVAKPLRNGANAGWTSLVDVFYDRLVLGIRNDNGLVCVRRNGSLETSAVAIPDGQITILSLIVQMNGAYKVYANGTELLSNATASPLTALVPGVAGPYANSITVGRNAPDGWTTFNGDIGDVFLYRSALSDPERHELETYLRTQLAEKPHTTP